MRLSELTLVLNAIIGKGLRMRKSASLLFAAFVCTLCFTGTVSAQANVRSDIPPVLLSGMEAYKPGAPEQGIKA